MALATTEVVEQYLVLHDGPQANSGTTDAAQMVAAAAASGCGTAYVAVKGYNSVGQKLLDWATSQYWCWSNSTVTRVNTMQIKASVTSLGQVMGWSYAGKVDGPTTSKLTSFKWRTWAQGHFVFSPIRVGTIQHQYPWVQMDVKGDGTYYATWGRG